MDRRRFCKSCASLAVLKPFSLVATAAPKKIVGCALFAGSSSVGNPLRFFNTSGDEVIDDICRKEINTLNKLFEVSPNFTFLDDSESPNAYALAPRTKDDPGTVAMGRSLCLEQKAKGDYLAIIAILAHEWAHILQYKRKLYDDWVIRYELHADHMAGWYLMKTKRDNSRSLKQIADVFAGLGSNDFTNPDFHGTPRQRSANILSGAGGYTIVTESGEERHLDGQQNPADTLDQAYQMGLK